MSRRDDILEEIGLTPQWRLRREQPEPASAHAAAAPADDPPSKVEAAALQAAGGEDRSARIARMDWTQLEHSVTGCTACPLARSRNRTVFGVGDQNADWLFIGEGPGAEEDRQGEPFVGQAGKLLDNMLAAIGLRRDADVYIANVVKCRPPGNRNPEPVEAGACAPYLQRQIALLQPRLIVALGKVAAVNLLQREATIASLRGKVHHAGDIPLIVTYHPAYLLRNLPDKAKAWTDLCFARDTMKTLKEGA
jgi:DNA polymerase